MKDMRQAIKTALLIKAARFIMNRLTDPMTLGRIRERVAYYTNMDIPSDEKKKAVIRTMRAHGVETATFLLGIVVDLAVGEARGFLDHKSDGHDGDK